MASVLGQQLAQLKALQGPQSKWVRGTPSLLFDYQQAADTGADTLLAIAQTGIAQLSRVEPRFKPYAETLFSRAALAVARDQLTAEENAALDANLNPFLHLLADHFLSPACFQVLEFCVRRYKVNEQNLPALFAAALPYHSTNEFVRLVQICALKGTIWDWLAPIQESGAALPRPSLVQRCVRDQSVLRFICKAAETLGTGPSPSRTFLSFYAVTVCELLAAAPSVNEDLVSLLLPQLVAGLSRDAGRDFAAATVMVLSRLSSRAALGTKLLNVVTVQAARASPTLGLATPLMLLAHIANTQPQLTELPRKAVLHLAAQPDLPAEVSSLQSKGARLSGLLRLLLSSLSDLTASDDESASKAAAAGGALCALCSGAELAEGDVQAAAARLLAAGAALLSRDGDAATAALERVCTALKAFDLRHPSAVDAAVNAALGDGAAAAAAAAAADAGSSKPKGGKGSKKGEQRSSGGRDAVFELVQRCFAGSSHAPLEGAAGAQTLAVAVHAPAEGVRIMAIQKLDEAVSGPSATDEARSLLSSAALSALRHDTFPVAAAAAAAASLGAVASGAQLLPALEALLQRAAEAIAAGGKGSGSDAADAAGSSSSSSKAAFKAAKPALAAVAALARREPDTARACAAAVLEQALSDKRRRRLAAAAVSAAAGGWHPLAAAVAAAGPTATADEETEDKKGAAAAANRAVADSLGHWLAEGGAAEWEEASAVAAIGGPRARHLLLLAALRATALLSGGGPTRSAGGRRASKAAGNSGLPAAWEGALRLLVAMLPGGAAAAAARAATLPSDWQAVSSEMFESGDALPTAAHASAEAAGGPPAALERAHGAALLRALHTALDAAPAAALDTAVGQPEAVFALLARHAYPAHPSQQQQPAGQQAEAAAGEENGGPALAALSPHLRLLVSKAAAGRELEFLEGFYAVPRDASRWYAQAAALQLLASDVEASGIGGWLAAGAVRQLQPPPLWLARAAGAACSPSPQVRAAAARLLTAPGALRAALALKGAGTALALEGSPLSAEQLLAVCDALEPHAALLRANPRALPLLLHGALTAAPDGGGAADATAAAGGARGGRTRGRHPQGAAAAAAAAALQNAVLRAPDGALDAFESYLLAALPALGDAEGLPSLALCAAALPGAAPPERLFAASAPLLAALLRRAASGDAVPYSTAGPGHKDVGPTDAQAAMQAAAAAAAAALLPSFTAASVATAPAATLDAVLGLIDASAAAAAPASSAPLAASAAAGAVATLAPLRAAALRLVTPDWFAALPPAPRARAFRALLLSSAADADAAGRALARTALEALPVDASALIPLILGPLGRCTLVEGSEETTAPGTPAGRAKRARGAAGAAASQPADGEAAAAGGGPGNGASDLAVSALELLQWKDVSGADQLVAPLHALLSALRPHLGSIAAPHDLTGGEEEEEEEEGRQAGSAGGASQASAAAGYAAQLALLALRRIAAAAAAPTAAPAPPKTPRGKKGAAATTAAAASGGGALPEGFDVSLVLSVLAAAPDAALRNAALGLLAVLARAAPAAMLGHVLEATRLIHESAAATDDAHSQATAASALAAVVPAWVGAGRDPSELWGALVGALGGAAPHRRLPLLAAMLHALPKEAGLPIALAVMLQRAAADAAAAPAPAKKRRGSAKEQEEEEAAATARECEWLPELASALCDQVAPGERLSALSSALAAAGGAEPVLPLPRLAVVFVAAQLKSKALSAAARAESAAASAPQPAADGDADTPPPSSPVLDGCLAVMRLALTQLQSLHPSGEDEDDASLAAVLDSSWRDDDETAPAAASDKKKQRGGRQRAVDAATAGLYRLLGVLRGVMEPAQYVSALLMLSDHGSDHVTRRALALFADRLAGLASDTSDWEEGLDEAAAKGARKRLARAAMALAGRLPALLGAARGDAARQAALVAADAALARFGAARPADALAALPLVLAVASDAAAPSALRASALAAAASAAAALGPRLVPQLPAAAGAALGAAESALAQLAASGSPSEEEGEEAAREEQGLLLASALAALEALSSSLGGFMSPYLPRLLALSLSPATLACTDGGAASRAATLRDALPAKVPPRLLVDPLAAAWDGALASCRPCGGAEGEDSRSAAHAAAYVEAGADLAAPAVAHLELVAALASSMDHKTAAAHAEPLFALLLRALDTRQRQLALLSGDEGEQAAAAAPALCALAGGGAAAVEAAACSALVALVMKLSEAKFKPMFIRLTDWAAAASAAAAAAASGGGAATPGAAGGEAAARAAAGSGLGRVAALLAAACALARRLRSVFASYHKYTLDTVIAQLLSPLDGEGGERPKKKRKKASEAAAADTANTLADGGDAAAAAALAAWLCRVRAVRALHLLAAHPAAPGPMEHERFTRLLGPLAKQLTAPAPSDAGPVPRLAAALAAQCEDTELDGPATALARLGPAGVAAANAATGARADDGGAAAAAPPPAAAADALAAAAAAALVALGLSGGSDAAWKPLAHAALSAARTAAPSAAGARTKLLALGVISRLVAALREEWLVLVPEVLPYLAELVEDPDASVEAAAQGLLAQLEEVSGEKLDAYLRA